jgi:hypothetical protein
MPKLAARFLVLSILTTSLLVMPIVTCANAVTTSHKHVKKKRVRVVHQSPKLADPGANPFSSNYENDFDRKNAGGGGGY